MVEKKVKQKVYKPILNDVPDWPVYRLSKNKKKFLEEVSQRSIEYIKSVRPSRKKLIDEIEITLYREQNRMKRSKWRIDPPDEETFWLRIKNDLSKLKPEKTTEDEPEHKMLHSIVHRYTKEIAGNFKPSYYRFARKIIVFFFSRLLNGANVKKFGAIFRHKYTLRDKVGIVGALNMLRKLAKKGTVVIVPTHFSNLDSIVIGWVIHSLGLPPFIYGAGLNLFNIKILAYFMESLGAYKVDRRKKNLLYLETLKMYSTVALEQGAHSIFFPGGTRSRSGAIESQLRVGLLSTTVEAQRNLFMKQQHTKEEPRKIFIVPITFNYQFVLEAPELIEGHLHAKGPNQYFPEHDNYGSFQLLKFMIKFFTKGSRISVSIGRGMDVIGNYVDKNGNSLNAQGEIIHLRDYFVSHGAVCVDSQRENEYTRTLSQSIVKTYYSITQIYASHLVAFVAFKEWQKKYNKLDLFGLLRLPEKDMEIEYEQFKRTFGQVRDTVFRLEKDKKKKYRSALQGDLDKVIQDGINNIGIFHVKRPLLKNKKGNIITRDLATLYYYHNRLSNHGIE